MESREYKADARNVLEGKWLKIAIIVFVYNLIFFICSKGDFEIFRNIGTFNIDLIGSNPNEGLVNNNINTYIYHLIFMGVIELGYLNILINIIQNKDFEFIDLFSKCKYTIKVILLTLLVIFYILCWAVLFIIPGIYKAYAYSMSFNILAQNPEMGLNECISRSQDIMDGQKFNLFCLQFSFIGLQILIQVAAIAIAMVICGFYDGNKTIITLAIQGFVFAPFFTAYKDVSEMVFYLDISEQLNNNSNNKDVVTQG